MPVMTPGSAISSTSRNDTDSRSKKRKGAIARPRQSPGSAPRRWLAAGLEREPGRVANLLRVPGDAEPVGRVGLCGAAVDVGAVEGVDEDQEEGSHRNATTSHDQTASAVRLR